MPTFFERFVAFRYLKSKRKEVFISIITVISVISVALSVMVLDIVLSIMTGFEDELQAKLIDASAHLTIKRFAADVEHVDQVVEIIKKDPDVTGVSPFTYNQALLSTPAGSRGLLIRGISNIKEATEKLEKNLIQESKINDLFNPPLMAVKRPDGTEDEVQLPGLIVGKSLSDRLGLSVNSVVTVLSPQFGNTPQGLVPKTRRFLIVGIYSSGLVEYENGLAYASIPEAQRFFSLGDSVSGIEVSVKDLFQAKVVGERIINSLSEAGISLYATDWTEPNKALWEAMKLEKQVYFIVLLLLILIASFTIVSTLVLIVMEKGKDIAVLKTLGASNKMIVKIFMLQGMIVGGLGISLGTILGFSGCIALREFGFPLNEAVFSLKQVPVHMIPSNFILVAVAAFWITFFAGVYPAKRASSLNPAEALRYE